MTVDALTRAEQETTRAQKVATARRMVSEKLPTSQIVAATGLAASTVNGYRRELPGYRKRPHAPIEKAPLQELIDRNLTIGEIAHRFGVTERTIHRALVRLEIREPVVVSAFDESLALRLLADRASYPEVARTVGVPVDRLRDRYPGYEWTPEDRSIFAAIRNNPTLARLHRELYGDAAA